MKEVLINGRKWPLRFGVRFELDVEEKLNRTFGKMTDLNTRDTIHMFYLALENGARKQGTQLDFSIEELIDAIDENPSIIKTFEEAMVEAYVVPKG